MHPFNIFTAAFSLLNIGRGVLGVPNPNSEHNLVERQARTTPILTVFPGQAALPTLADIINLNATNGTFLPIQNIQGDILVGMKKQLETFYFFHINDPASFKTALNSYVPTITSTATLLSPASSQPLAFVNIAFSSTGLQALGITDDLGDSQFSSGMYADATNLGDSLSTWESPFAGTNIHGAFLIGTDKLAPQNSYVSFYVSGIVSTFGSSITEVDRIDASARPGDEAGHEHFGFLDGISNPAVAGFSTTVLPGQTVVPSGTILTGRLGDVALRPSWTLDGTFMAFRKLQQKVPEFDAWTLENAIQNPEVTLTVQQGADYLGARMFGRWKSGAPTDITPLVDDPTLGADPQSNNNFDFAHANSSLISDQSRCPFSAHIRKTNPRADLADANTINHAIRAGTPYGPEASSSEASSKTSAQDRGMAFVEYQSTIGNGFRFQQINWANTANFPPLKTVTPGIEPIVGQGSPRTADGLNPVDPSVGYTVPQFVIPTGGEYFFVPSISAITDVITAS
ncbi:hypothetical protein PHLCEN_2v9595 [Hermanssonia centrifuga]|uniref:Dye-decolorizing peroxidase n=1 Tax=Hermanssonia centrifuga TaxID=98765 RepID=A0A2R6NQE2_9APHY|nr:hypothetical protein PHLCEN_2v9595 [Hermanssonia centrifuga]